jgi:hypothetical protein
VNQDQPTGSDTTSFALFTLDERGLSLVAGNGFCRFVFHDLCPYAIEQQLLRAWPQHWWSRWGELQHARGLCSAADHWLLSSPLITGLSSVLLWAAAHGLLIG